jgi:hypothetical protein
VGRSVATNGPDAAACAAAAATTDATDEDASLIEDKATAEEFELALCSFA